MGFYEDDRIRSKNRQPEQEEGKLPKRDEFRFKLELHGNTSITDVVEALAEAGLAIRLETNNRVIVKK